MSARDARALLAAAPELAVVAIVERALEVLVTTLRNEHPTVDDLAAPDEARSVQRARNLIEHVHRTRAAIRGYSLAVRRAFEVDPSDDLPF